MAELISTVEAAQTETRGLFSVSSTADGRALARHAAAVMAAFGSMGPGGFGDALLGAGGGGVGSGVFGGTYLGGAGAGNNGGVGGGGGLHALGAMAMASAVGSNAALLSARSSNNSGANTGRRSNNNEDGSQPNNNGPLTNASAAAYGYGSGSGANGGAGGADDSYGETSQKFWTSERDGQLLCFDTSPEATALFGLYSLQRIDVVPRAFTLHKQALADRQASVLSLSAGGVGILNASSRAAAHRDSLLLVSAAGMGDGDDSSSSPPLGIGSPRQHKRGGGGGVDSNSVSYLSRHPSQRTVPSSAAPTARGGARPAGLSVGALLSASSGSHSPASASSPRRGATESLLAIGAAGGAAGSAALPHNPQLGRYKEAIATVTNYPIATTAAGLTAGHPAAIRGTVLGVYDRELWILSDSSAKAVPLKGANGSDLLRHYRIAVVGLALEFPLPGIGGGGASAFAGGGIIAAAAGNGGGSDVGSVAGIVDPLIGGDALSFNQMGLKGQSASASLTSSAGAAAAGGTAATVGGTAKGLAERAAAASAAQSAEAVLERLFAASRPRAFLTCSYAHNYAVPLSSAAASPVGGPQPFVFATAPHHCDPSSAAFPIAIEVPPSASVPMLHATTSVNPSSSVSSSLSSSWLIPPPPPVDSFRDGAAYMKPFLVQWPIRYVKKNPIASSLTGDGGDAAKPSSSVGNVEENDEDDDDDFGIFRDKREMKRRKEMDNDDGATKMTTTSRFPSSTTGGGAEEEHDSTAWWASQQRLSWDVLKRTATHIHTSSSTLSAALSSSGASSGGTSSSLAMAIGGGSGGGGASQLAGKDANHVLLTILLDTRDEAIRFVTRGRFGLGDRLASAAKLPRPAYRGGEWRHYGPAVHCTAVGVCYGLLFGIYDASLEEGRSRLGSVGMGSREAGLFVVAPIAPLGKFELVSRGVGASGVSGAAEGAKKALSLAPLRPTPSQAQLLLQKGSGGIGSSAGTFGALLASLQQPAGLGFSLPPLTATEVISIVPAEFLRAPIFGCTAAYHSKAVTEAMQSRREAMRDVLLASGSGGNSNNGSSSSAGADGAAEFVTETDLDPSSSAVITLPSSSSSASSKLWRTLTEAKFGPLASFQGTAAFEAEQLEVLTRGKGGFAMMDPPGSTSSNRNNGGPNNSSSSAAVSGADALFGGNNMYAAPAPLHHALTAPAALQQMYPEAYRPFGPGRTYSLADERLVEECYAAWRLANGLSADGDGDSFSADIVPQQRRRLSDPPPSYDAFIRRFISANKSRLEVSGPSGLDLAHVRGLFAQYQMRFSSAAAVVASSSSASKRGEGGGPRYNPALVNTTMVTLSDALAVDPSAMMAEFVSWTLASCGLGALPFGHTASEGMLKLLIAADVTVLPRSVVVPSLASGGVRVEGGAAASASASSASLPNNATRMAAAALGPAPSRLPPLPRWSDWEHHQTVAAVHAEAAQRRAIFDAGAKEWSALVLDHRFKLRQILSKTFDGEEALVTALAERKASSPLHQMSSRMMAVMAPTESAARNVEAVMRTMSFASTASAAAAATTTAGGLGMIGGFGAAGSNGGLLAAGSRSNKKRGSGNGNIAADDFSAPIALRPRSSRLPWEFPYVLAKGRHVSFDVSYEACRPFGAFHGQRFRCTRGDSNGVVVVIIGVLVGRLWRYREDGLAEAQPFAGTSAADIFVNHGLELLEPAEAISISADGSAAARGSGAVAAAGDDVSPALRAFRQQTAKKKGAGATAGASAAAAPSAAESSANYQHSCLGAETELSAAAKAAERALAAPPSGGAATSLRPTAAATASGGSAAAAASSSSPSLVPPCWVTARSLRSATVSPSVRTADPFLYHTLQGDIVDFDVSREAFAALAAGAVTAGDGVGANRITMPPSPVGVGFTTAIGSVSSGGGASSSSSGGGGGGFGAFSAAPPLPPIRFGDRYVIGNPDALERLCNTYEMGAIGVAKRRAAGRLAAAAAAVAAGKVSVAAINAGGSAGSLSSTRHASPRGGGTTVAGGGGGRLSPNTTSLGLVATSPTAASAASGGPNAAALRALAVRPAHAKALCAAASQSPAAITIAKAATASSSSASSAPPFGLHPDASVTAALYRGYLTCDDATGTQTLFASLMASASAGGVSGSNSPTSAAAGAATAFADDASPPPFATLTIIGVREGRLWYAVDECGAQPFDLSSSNNSGGGGLGGVGSSSSGGGSSTAASLEAFFSTLQLTYLYTADVESSALDFMAAADPMRRVAIFNVQKVGPAVMNTSPDAIAPFGPFVHGQIVYVSNGLAGVFGGSSSPLGAGAPSANSNAALSGFPTTIIGVRGGRLYHQPPEASYCTAFDVAAPQLMRTLKFTTRGERAQPFVSRAQQRQQQQQQQSSSGGRGDGSVTQRGGGVKSSARVGETGERSLAASTNGNTNASSSLSPSFGYSAGEPLRLASPIARFRAQHFAFPSPSGDIYLFDVSDASCRVVFGFSHGDRVKLTRPPQQAGRCVVVLGVRAGQLWYVDEQLGVSAVFHGLRDRKALMAGHGLVWVGRTAVRESIG